MTGAVVRPEAPSDVAAVAAVTAAAFEDHPFSSGSEPFIVDALRRTGALALSLVAEADGRVVGHIAFSPVELSDGTPGWYGLGPVSVLPAFQRRGIGSALVLDGLSRLKDLGGRGCVLVGEPRFYGRFGFKARPDLRHEGVPPEVFLALPFAGRLPRGAVAFHEAFRADASAGRPGS